MGGLLTRVGSTYYLKKVNQSSTILHYKRSPTWRSALLLIVLYSVIWYISSQSPYFSIRWFCYVVGFYFCYLATEKYEEVKFDKARGTVELMNARFIEKHLIGYQRKIVTELENVVSVSVETQSVSPGTGYMVVLLLFSGMTLSLTAQCTFGNNKEHKIIAKEIRKFLGTSEGDIQNGYSETAAKKDQ